VALLSSFTLYPLPFTVYPLGFSPVPRVISKFIFLLNFIGLQLYNALRLRGQVSGKGGGGKDHQAERA